MHMLHISRRRFGTLMILGATLLLLHGCAQLRPRGELPPQALPTNWENSGKIALNINAQGQEQPGSNHVLRYVWQQQGEDYTLKLSGAFGLGAVVIQREGDSVTLTRGENVIAQASDSEDLFFQHTGLWLPVSLLRYWITGAPDAAAANKPVTNTPVATEQNTAARHIAGFVRNGWTVSYPKVDQWQGYTLPRKMVASGQEAALTVAIARWHFDIQ